MCHICRKVASLDDVDSKAKKWIFNLLSKLHKSNEEDLREFWQIRQQHMTKLQNFLIIFPQKALVKGLLDYVDGEMRHIEKNMHEHPVGNVGRRLKFSESTLAPNDSMSVEIRAERECLNNSPPSKMERTLQQARNGEGREPSPVLSEKQGSDLDPPPVVMMHSIRKVDTWIDRIDDATEDAELSKERNISMKEAAELWQEKKRRKESTYMMSGRSSPAESTRRFRESRDNTNTGTSFEGKPVARGDRVYHDLSSKQLSPDGIIYSKDSYTASSMSSRSSVTNLGSLMKETRSSLFQLPHHCSSLTSRTNSSRPTGRKSPSTPIATTPGAKGKDRSVTPTQIQKDLNEVSKAEASYQRQDNLQSGRYSAAVSPKPNTNKPLPLSSPLGLIQRDDDAEILKSRLQGKTESNGEVSEAVKASRRRRREESKRETPSFDEYRKKERERIWRS